MSSESGSVPLGGPECNSGRWRHKVRGTGFVRARVLRPLGDYNRVVNRRTLCALSVLALTACHRAADAHGPAPAPAAPPPIERPAHPLSTHDAERYVVALVNRDRAAEGLPPVGWDEVAAKAGREHVEDMTKNGYAGHWGTDGSVPEERYTNAGGQHLVQENAACLSDAERRELDPRPTFTADELEAIEAAFMNEKPPHDGHRKNILKKWHTGVGIGLARAKGIPKPCLVQEFTDEYGSYRELPKKTRVGQTITVAGEVHGPVTFGGIGVARIDPAKPVAAKDLLKRSTYPMPEPFVLYSPPGYKTPKPVQVHDNRFTVDIPLSEAGRPGRYAISVWVTFRGEKDLAMASLRVISVR